MEDGPVLGSPVGAYRLIRLTSNDKFSMTRDNQTCITPGQVSVHRCLRFFGMVDDIENRHRKKPQKA